MIDEVKWYRLAIDLVFKKDSTEMKSHPVSVIQAINKAVSSRTPPFSALEIEDMPIFHIKDKKHTFKMSPQDIIHVDFLFFKQNPQEISLWRHHLVEYLSKPVYSQTVEVLTIGDIEERTYTALCSQYPNLPGQGEICLEFLMPLAFTREAGRSRAYLSKEQFIGLFEKRFSALFGRPFTYRPQDDDFFLLPYYWNYTEIKHPSRSQPGNTQFINGLTGKLYIKGTWKSFLPYLILGSEVHTGARMTNSQGYYRVLPDSPPFFGRTFPDPLVLAPVIQDVIERYDQALEALSKKEMVPFAGQAFARDLCREISQGTYCPTPNTAFVISQGNKKERLVEQLSFKDLIVCRYLGKHLRKPLSDYFAQEYQHPPLPSERFDCLVDDLLPAGDTLVKNLLKRVAANGYTLDNRYFPRLDVLDILRYIIPPPLDQAPVDRLALVLAEPGLLFCLSGDMLVIKRDGKIVDTFPLKGIREIIVPGSSLLSAALLRMCSEYGIPVSIRLESGYTVPVIQPVSGEALKPEFFD